MRHRHFVFAEGFQVARKRFHIDRMYRTLADLGSGIKHQSIGWSPWSWSSARHAIVDFAGSDTDTMQLT